MEAITCRDEGIKDDLRPVEEVSELSLPDGQQPGLADAHPVLKAQNGLLRQRAVAHLHRRWRSSARDRRERGLHPGWSGRVQGYL